MPDPIFADPRLAVLYDDFDGDRSDLDHYESILGELGATRVIDLGCGTGTLACRLAARGLSVIGVDPAQASLDVARTKTSAEDVTWALGDATTLPDITVDAVTMTGNVAQVFLDDNEWHATLLAIRAVLDVGGHLVFETREPAARAWEAWARTNTQATVDTVAGRVEQWVDVTGVELPFVSFRHSFRFVDRGDVVTSDSTLRFRDRDDVTATLVDSGFVVADVRDAPDRPGLELVFIARAV